MSAAEPKSEQSPDAALKQLQQGNARFAASFKSDPKPTRARRLETAQKQHPIAIIVGCADSRTGPEIIFDQNIGDLFVVRTAGNVVDDHALGSIEYAVEHLGTRLVIVLGHARCGAVSAALDNGSAPGHIGSIVRDIRPSVEAVRGQAGELLVNAIKENVRRVAETVRQKAELGDLASAVKVAEAYYDLDTGKVAWLGPH
ncbi:MAG: carbonic anhydrase [Verrucomicrobia bacterium]|nr:carbonic anhydrase [Verrucomicrobiota bacterium]